MIIPFVSFSQGVINNNAKMNITAGTFFNIDAGGFTNNAGGEVTNAGTIQVEGDWVNNDAGGVFATTNAGTVELNGNAQNIGGTRETNFFDLLITDNPTGGTNDPKTLTGTGFAAVNGAKVYGTLTLDDEKLFLNQHTLTMENSGGDNAASPAFNFSGASGFVVSETGPAIGNYGIVKWNMGTSPSADVYTVPFGSNDASPQYIPFVYDLSAAVGPTPAAPGVAPSQYKTFATYGTNEYNGFLGGAGGINDFANGPFNWDNLPEHVDFLTDDYSQASHFWVVDRFWIIDEENTGAGPNNIPGDGDDPAYTARPTAAYTFTYDANEAGTNPYPGNHINNNLLVPQRYNHDENRWGDWLYSQPNFTNNPGGRQLTMTVGRDATTWLEDMYPVWTLVDNSDPLPIELVRFAGECAEGSIDLKWTTFTETNNDFFTVERSNNGTDFEVVDVIEGAGNSNQPLSYTAVDNFPYGGTSYYRLKNTDFSGKFEYSEIIAVTCGTDNNDFNFVNAYDVDHTEIIVEFTATENEDYTIVLFDVSGRIALDYSGVGTDGMNKVRLPSGDLARGIYIINLSNEVKNFSRRVMLK